MNLKTERQHRGIAESFVRSLHGKYRASCADDFLVEMILLRLRTPSYSLGKSLGDLALAGDHTAAYDAVLPIFESILESACGHGGNGHHEAQGLTGMLTGCWPTKRKPAVDGYPKGIEMELRNSEERFGEGLLVRLHWFEVFWHLEARHSSLELVTGYDEHGDNVYERIDRVENDCFEFRGKVYEFCSFRSIAPELIPAAPS